MSGPHPGPLPQTRPAQGYYRDTTVVNSHPLASLRRRLPRGIGYISSATIYRERLEHGHGMARYPARYALVGRGADIANPSSASPYPRLSSIARLIGWVSATRA